MMAWTKLVRMEKGGWLNRIWFPLDVLDEGVGRLKFESPFSGLSNQMDGGAFPWET